ncbi:hypothetical protein L249_5364, partial [Ophiocordyceps polyrhachis-furcata BCC 54312]
DSGAISEGGSRNVLAENRYLGMQIVALVYIEEGPALALNETDWRSAVSVKLSLLDSHYVVAIFRKKSKVDKIVRLPYILLVLEAIGSRRVCGSSPVLVLAGYFIIPGL